MAREYSRLLQQIDNVFNAGEIETLCFSLGIDFDNLAGDTKTEKIRELILYCARTDNLSGLIAICQSNRPNYYWSTPQLLERELDPDMLFREAVHNRLIGDLGETKRLLILVKDIDPHYPGLETQLREVDTEMRRPYMGMGEIINPEAVYQPYAPPFYGQTKEKKGCRRFRILGILLLIILFTTVVALALNF